MNGKILRKYRIQRGLLQKDIAEAVGVTAGRICQIEGRSRIQVKDELAYRIGKIVKAPWGELMNDKQVDKVSKIIEVPILGDIPSTGTIGDSAYGRGYLEVPTVLVKGVKSTNLFALKVAGNTLLGDGIADGDYLVVDRKGLLKDGELGIVQLGDDIFCRHIYRSSGKVRLISSNGYQEFLERELEIIGRVILSGHWRHH